MRLSTASLIRFCRAPRALFLTLALAWPGTAGAIPAFARKYGMSCSACHEAWPKLSDQGIAFRDNGYQWGTGKDSPIKLDPTYWPIALRSTVGYQYSSLTNQATNGGPATVHSGRIGYTGVDLLMAGTLTHDVSFLAVLEPFLTNAGLAPNANGAIASPGETGLMESLWVRFDNLLATSWLNFKLGRGALDLPFDEHRSLTVLTPFDIYHYHPGGSANSMPFAVGENQFQATLEGHNAGSSTRYAVGLIQTQDDPGSALVLSSPGVYAHVQHSFYPPAGPVPEIRAGLLAMAGSYPTMALYSGGPAGTPAFGPLQNPDGTQAPIVPNTAYGLREFYREGADLSVYLGNLSLPVNLEIAYVAGQEDPAFISGATREALFHGGFVEADWTPLLNLSFAARWDTRRNLRQGDPSQPANFLAADGATAVVRYTFEFVPRTEVALHAEVSYQHIAGAGAGGADTESLLGFGGVDFAF